MYLIWAPSTAYRSRLGVEMANRRSLIILGALLAALVPGLFVISQPFLTPGLIAAVLAIVFHPANQWLVQRLKRPGLATACTTTLVVLGLGLLVILAGITLTGELRTSYDALNQRSLDQGGWPALVTRTADQFIERLAAVLPLDKNAIRESFQNGLRSAAGKLLNYAGTVLGGVTSLVVGAFFTAVFLYFLLLRGQAWLAGLTDLIPLDRAVIATLFQTVDDSVTATIYGVVAVAAGQGLFLTFGFWVADVRSPPLWGALGGFASIIPVLGAPLVWVPVVLGLALGGAWWKALFLGLWGAFIVGSVDNVLRPLVVGVRAKQHPLLMALGALGGTFAFGVSGILAGPVMVSLAGALIREIHALPDADRTPR